MNRRQMLGTAVGCTAGALLPLQIKSEEFALPELVLNDKHEIVNIEELKKHPLVRQEDLGLKLLVKLPPNIYFQDDNDVNVFFGYGTLLFDDEPAEAAEICRNQLSKDILTIETIVDIVSTNDDLDDDEDEDEDDAKPTKRLQISVISLKEGIMQRCIFEESESVEYELAKKMIAEKNYPRFNSEWDLCKTFEHLISNHKEFEDFVLAVETKRIDFYNELETIETNVNEKYEKIKDKIDNDYKKELEQTEKRMRQKYRISS